MLMQGVGFAWNYILVIGLMLLVIIFLSINTFKVYQRGKSNFDQIIYEREKLDELLAEGELLESELEYRKSYQFVESFAHENLYLGRLGERLYKVDRDEDVDYELARANLDPIKYDDNEYWWKKIFLW